MRKSIIAGLAAVLSLIAAAAVAQPYNYTVSPGLVPFGAEVEGYHVDVAGASFSVTYLKNQTNMILNNSGSVNGTVTFYAYPFDGQIACMFSKGGVGTLTLNAGLGTQSVSNTITALTANTEYCFQYVNAAASWYRVQ